jgi:hypothetical protein
MKRFLTLVSALFFSVILVAQSPQRLSYQSVIRNSAGKLVQNSNIGLRISILQGSATATAIYAETHSAATNDNGLVTVEIGNGNPVIGTFGTINWAVGPYYLKIETDITGGTNYTITGVSQLLSVPYALWALKAGDAFSGDYNDLTNKPVTDGSETKVQAGTNVTVTGTGTIAAPYVVSSSAASVPTTSRVTLVSNQTWTVPSSVSKIKVELWGASGGGGGAGAYSYSYNLNNGGNGGSGGYALQEYDVVTSQQFYVVIGQAGNSGSNAVYSSGYWHGDTDGGNGGDSWFGTLKAAGGSGGKRGSYSPATVHGSQGTANVGDITGYSDVSYDNILDVFQGLPRGYINDRVLTSKPGKGGSVSGYSQSITPTQGEGGCAVITLFE